jgi:hypothetical protein
VTTLLNPEMHSFHCLLDVSVCNSSPYYILVPPAEGDNMYSVGWQLSSNDMAQAAGRALGSQSSGCSTCAETGTQAMGFRASVTGTVTTIDPPVLNVLSVTALEGDDVGCMDSSTNGEGEMMVTTKSPASAPVFAVAIPTGMPVDVVVPVDTTSNSPTDATPFPTGSPTIFSPLVTDSPTITPTDSLPTSASSATPTGSTSVPAAGEGEIMIKLISQHRLLLPFRGDYSVVTI